MIGMISLGVFIFFIFLNVPISFSMGTATMIGLSIMGIKGQIAPQQMVTGIESWSLLAIPFFILTAQLMNKGGLTESLFDFAEKLIGWVKGGLAHTNVLASMIFAGISGAAVADASGLGLVEIRAMKEAGYDENFAVGVTAASCMLGPIIPPSVMLIIYGHLAEVSIAALWFAGIIPGILTGLLLMGYIFFAVSRNITEAPGPSQFSISKIAQSLLDNILVIPLPVLLLLAIVTGLATPTETGIIASIYALMVGTIYGGKDFLRKIPEAIKATTKSTATITFIISVSTAFVWLITREQTAILLADFLLSITDNKFLLLTIINVFLLIVGSLIEQVPAMVIIVPLLSPLATQLGMNPVQFGLMTVFNLMIGMITPPMGMALYIMGSITEVPMRDIIRSSMKFFFVLVMALLLITYIPILSTFIPRTLGFPMF